MLAYLEYDISKCWRRLKTPQWVSDCCLTPIQQFFSNSWQEQVNIHWDDIDDVPFVLDQHANLHFYSASSLKQKSAGRHVAPLGHIILIPSQPICGEATNSNFIVFGLTRTHDVLHSRRACWPLRHQCDYEGIHVEL